MLPTMSRRSHLARVQHPVVGAAQERADIEVAVLAVAADMRSLELLGLVALHAVHVPVLAATLDSEQAVPHPALCCSSRTILAASRRALRASFADRVRDTVARADPNDRH